MRTFKNFITTLAAIATLGGISNAQVGFVKVPYAVKEKSILAEPNVFYKLPLGVSGYTFMQLTNKDCYYGKTFLKRKIMGNDAIDLKAKSTIVHSNHLYSRGGIGGSIDLKFLPKGLNFSAGYLPLWITKEGKLGKGTLDFCISADEKIGLPKGMKMEIFGEWGTKDWNWTYGEARIQQKLTKGLSIAYNPALNGDCDPIPEIQHRLSAIIDF